MNIQSSPEQPINRVENLQASKIEIQAKSIASEQHPDRNEDALFQIPERKTFGVFDGMGGHAAGDVASRIARYNVEKSLKELPDGLSLEQTQRSLSTTLKEAHEKIAQQARSNPSLKDMGTTASIVKIWEGSQGERKAVIGNVGDSRVYVMRASGLLEQITLDDNTIRQMMARQIISGAEARALQNKLNNVTDLSRLSTQERSVYENRNVITQALGHANVSPRIHVVDVRVGDKLIVTSDGIHDNLTDNEISTILAQSPNNQKAVENLTESARIRSRDTNHPRSKPDDISAVIAEVSPTGQAKVEPPKPLVQSQLKETGRLVVGDVVKVQRSSGVIEEGWKIEGFNPKTGDVIVRRREGGQTFEKDVPQEELKALNPPKQEAGIGGATDFIQLFNTIDGMGKIQGSQQAFEPAQLIRLINGVRSGKEPIDSITRAGGLREKVAELIEADRIRASLAVPSEQSENPNPESNINRELNIGNKKIKIGDYVLVKRTSGEIESDWSLKSFGTKYAVVEKPANEQGDLLRKPIEFEEFKRLQANQQYENQDVARGSESKDPKLFITMWRNRFIELEKTGNVDKIDEGMVENFYWQQVRYGEGVKGRNDQLYRGYLMVEPEKLPLALGVLAKTAEQRKARGITTEFKWLLRTEEPDWIDKINSGQDWKPKEVGEYPYLKPEDPRIALYADTPQEIQNILNALAQHPQWQTIEENRIAKYSGKAPRRPGTNAFIDPLGREFRSLNYNDKPGYSEDEVINPHWRMQKIGTPTQNL